MNYDTTKLLNKFVQDKAKVSGSADGLLSVSRGTPILLLTMYQMNYDTTKLLNKFRSRQGVEGRNAEGILMYFEAFISR